MNDFEKGFSEELEKIAVGAPLASAFGYMLPKVKDWFSQVYESSGFKPATSQQKQQALKMVLEGLETPTGHEMMRQAPKAMAEGVAGAFPRSPTPKWSLWGGVQPFSKR